MGDPEINDLLARSKELQARSLAAREQNSLASEMCAKAREQSLLACDAAWRVRRLSVQGGTDEAAGGEVLMALRASSGS